MADLLKKNVLNVRGRYFVDTNCIDCHVCVLIAPHIFSEDDDKLLVYVRQQPQEQEEKLVNQAIRECPTSSIGVA